MYTKEELKFIGIVILVGVILCFIITIYGIHVMGTKYEYDGGEITQFKYEYIDYENNTITTYWQDDIIDIVQYGRGGVKKRYEITFKDGVIININEQEFKLARGIIKYIDKGKR